jgi:hypothetical protein
MPHEIKLTVTPVLDPAMITAARELLRSAEYALECGRRLLALLEEEPPATLGGPTEPLGAAGGAPGPPPVPETPEDTVQGLFQQSREHYYRMTHPDKDGGEYTVADPRPYDERPKYVPNPEPPEVHPIEVPDVPQAPDQFNPQTPR